MWLFPKGDLLIKAKYPKKFRRSWISDRKLCLSKRGPLTLVQAVLSSIPTTVGGKISLMNILNSSLDGLCGLRVARF